MDPVQQLPTLPDNATIPGQLKSLAESKPTKAAFIFIDCQWNRISLSRQQVWDYSRRFAAVLNRIGVRKGDVVCNCLANSPQRIFTSYGTVISGGIPLHGQVLLADGEDFFHNLQTSNCTTVLLDPNEGDQGANRLLNSIKYRDEQNGKDRYRGLPHLVNALDVEVYECDVNSCSSYDTWLERLSREDLYENTDMKADDTAWMFVTSGTTGFSKIVGHTHTAVLNFGLRMGTGCGVFDENSVYFCDRSLGWIAGHPIVFPTLGCTRVLTNFNRGSPENPGAFANKIILQEECTCSFMVPHHVQLMMDAVRADSGKARHKLSYLGSGGRPLQESTMECLGILTDAIRVIYGSTECGLIAVLTIKDKSQFKPFCVGKTCLGVEAKIVDKTLEEVPVGKTGEILIRSLQNTKGYLNETEKTKETILQDGWIRQGDVSYTDDNGQFYIINRMSDAIIRGIFIYYPGWMEARIRNCPGVERAALVGVPDKKMYEEICAFIIPTSTNSVTEEQLRHFCQGLFASAANADMVAVPKFFLFTDTLPMNPNGKLLRPLLKEEAIRRLGL